MNPDLDRDAGESRPKGSCAKLRTPLLVDHFRRV